MISKQLRLFVYTKDYCIFFLENLGPLRSRVGIIVNKNDELWPERLPFGNPNTDDVFRTAARFREHTRFPSAGAAVPAQQEDQHHVIDVERGEAGQEKQGKEQSGGMRTAGNGRTGEFVVLYCGEIYRTRSCT